MIKFLFQSAFVVSFFSFFRFILNLYFASFLFPSDFGIVVLPILIFGFLEIIVEAGYYTSIVKYDVPRTEVFRILSKRMKFGYRIGLLVVFIFLFINHFYMNNFLPPILVVAYFLGCLFKVRQFFYEAKLTADGRYILAEFVSFVTTIILTISIIILIPYLEVSGYYFLGLIATLHPLLTSILLKKFIIYDESKLKSNHDYSDIHIYSKNVRNSSIIDFFSNKVDEFFLVYFLSPALLGLLSKLKELYFLLGSFTSKIISRPWFYLVSRAKVFTAFIGYLGLAVSAIAIVILLNYFINYLLSIVLSILGSNWIDILNYTDEIIILTLGYFLVTFSRSTLLGFGAARFNLQLDIVISLSRLIIYSIFFMYFYDLESFKIFQILYFEMFLRFSTFLVQVIAISWKSLRSPLNESAV